MLALGANQALYSFCNIKYNMSKKGRVKQVQKSDLELSDTKPPIAMPSARGRLAQSELHDTIAQEKSPSTQIQISSSTEKVPKELSRGIKRKGFKLTATIGAGGMGEVYEGINRRTKERVAVKFLKGNRIRTEQEIERFIDEAGSAMDIDHPGVVKIFKYGLVRGHPFIVMEYLEGTDLSVILKNKRLRAKTMSIGKALYFAREICEALQAAHSKNIIHRDIKPENIFVLKRDPSQEKFNRIKIIDFGLAKLVDLDETEASRLTKTGTMLGTPYYMAPESIQGDKLDHRVDLYSLGVMLYEMICGSRPFESDENKGHFPIIWKHINEQPAPFAEKNPNLEVPQKVEALVMKALAKNPDERFQSAQEMMEAIEECGIELSAPEFDFQEQVQAPEEKRSWFRRLSLRLGLAASIVVSGVYHFEQIKGLIVGEKVEEKAKRFKTRIESDVPDVEVCEEEKIGAKTWETCRKEDPPFDMISTKKGTLFFRELDNKREYYSKRPGMIKHVK
jgi:serine/threonine protein kinase